MLYFFILYQWNKEIPNFILNEFKGEDYIMKQCISTSDMAKRYRRTNPFRGSAPYPLFQSYKKNYNFENIRESVERWASYSESVGKSLDKVLELFDIVSDNGTPQQLGAITSRINENIIFSLDQPILLRPHIMAKINESNVSVESINSKLKSLKDKELLEIATLFKNATKNNYELNSVEKLLISMNKIVIGGGALLAGGVTIFVWILSLLLIVPSSVVIHKIYTNRIDQIEKAIAKCDNTEDKKRMQEYLKALKKNAGRNGVKEAADRNAHLHSILTRINEAVHCDRIIKNHNMISKRFNIESYVREHAYGDSINDTIYELCSFIDTWSMGINSKYSIALEEVLFTFSMNNIKIERENIVEAVTDYFLSNHMNPEDSSRELLCILGEAAEQNKCFNTEDIRYIKELQESITETVQEETLDTILEVSLRDKTKDLINRFKAQPAKSPEALKSLLNNILVVNKDNNLVDGTQNLLSIAFYFLCVVGAFSVGVYPGIFAAIVAKTVNFIVERKYMTDVLKVWYRKRDSVAKKVDKCKDDKKKAQLEEYLKQMDKSIDTLEAHSDALRGDDEKKSWNSRPTNYSKKDDDGFDFNINFDEEAKTIATDIAVIESAISSISWDQKANEKTLFASETILNMKLEDVDFLTEFCVKYPHMIDKNKFIEALEFADKQASKETGFAKYNKINCYAENMERLNTIETMLGSIEDLKGDPLIKLDNTTDVFGELLELQEYTEAVNSYVKCINELSLTSNLKLATDRLSKVVSNLSDKEKIMSRGVDSTCDMLRRSIEKAMTMENREAVIRGDILPSASKVIKLAITTAGVAWLIHPALAVIMLLGRFAMNAKLRTKERQLIMDELDVELTMIDKYIAIAEEKKDMKRLRELLLIKKKLQAQDARLKYKVKMEWNDKNVKPLGGKNEED